MFGVYVILVLMSCWTSAKMALLRTKDVRSAKFWEMFVPVFAGTFLLAAYMFGVWSQPLVEAIIGFGLMAGVVLTAIAVLAFDLHRLYRWVRRG